jgi:hypothetical protein
VVENVALERVGTEQEEGTAGWKKLHNEGLRKFCLFTEHS